MKKLLILMLTATLTVSALADGKVDFKVDDTTASLLKRQTGQRVEVRLKSGEKLSGKVEAVGEKAVHLSALAGQELFDAVVVLDDITAVLVRVSTK